MLPASVIACFVLVGEALIGSALVGERTWHASWWEWHALIVTAYVIILFAARNQWRQERFRQLYLPATRERVQEVSVLFADLVGFTTFTEQSPSGEIAAMLASYYGMATPLISEAYGGEVEKFMGDAIMATFNTRGDQPDHAVRAARAALELQREMRVLTAAHPDWPQLRVGVNTGQALVRELGGPGYVVYAVVGDTINVGARLQTEAPVSARPDRCRDLPAATPARRRRGLARTQGQGQTAPASTPTSSSPSRLKPLRVNAMSTQLLEPNTTTAKLAQPLSGADDRSTWLTRGRTRRRRRADPLAARPVRVYRGHPRPSRGLPVRRVAPDRPPMASGQHAAMDRGRGHGGTKLVRSDRGMARQPARPRARGVEGCLRRAGHSDRRARVWDRRGGSARRC